MSNYASVNGQSLVVTRNGDTGTLYQYTGGDDNSGPLSTNGQCALWFQGETNARHDQQDIRTDQRVDNILDHGNA
jgi:hypothetical protein